MLNRKLVKAGLFTNVLIFLVLISRASDTQPASDSMGKMTDTAALLQHLDPSLLQAKMLPAIKMEQAPSIRLNKQAAIYTDDYIAKNSRMLEKVKQNSSSIFATMNRILSKYNLPTELKYLAVVESELKTRAVSRVGATGLWQLMPATARIFSLKITPEYDERTHLYKSTVAAARYLNDLYALFDDWLLVIAAYNSGPGPVLKAIKRSGSRNFWKLQHLLPAETRAHVKKFISTHYFFEGKAGLTTLTRQETIQYQEALTAFVARQNIVQEKEVPEPADEQNNREEAIVRKSGTVAILTDEE